MTRVDLCGIELKNPVIAASGTFSVGREFDQYFDISKLGGISTTGLTLNKKEGNKGNRLYETPAGMMNSIGLENDGVEAFIEEDLDFLKSKETVIMANLGGGSLEEYIEGARLLENTDVDLVELNISCPNVKEGGMAFGIESDTAYEVVSKVRQVLTKPLIVKLSPNARNIVEMAKSCEEAGADGLSLVNTFNALAIDIDRGQPIFDNITAGLSGPAIKPIALRMVWEVCKNVSIPVIGLGGISCWQDAIEFIMAGATAVQVGSANFVKPDISLDIIEGIEKYMEDKGIESLDEIRGII